MAGCESRIPHPQHPTENGTCYGIWPATVAVPGTISHGTLRTTDLIDTFEKVLREVDPVTNGILNNWYIQQPGDAEDDEEYLRRITEALEEAAPEGYYFGAIEGDGSDFGFWNIPDFDGDSRDPRCDDCVHAPGQHPDQTLWIDTGTGTWGLVNGKHGRLVLLDGDDDLIIELGRMSDAEIVDYALEHGRKPTIQ